MRIHREFGTPLNEWIENIPNELEIDCVGLWQIPGAFSEGFGLEGLELDRAVRLAIEALLARGAVPIVSLYLSSEFQVRKDLLVNGRGDVDLIIAHWKSLDHIPSFEDIWFDIPGTEV